MFHPHSPFLCVTTPALSFSLSLTQTQVWYVAVCLPIESWQIIKTLFCWVLCPTEILAIGCWIWCCCEYCCLPAFYNRFLFSSQLDLGIPTNDAYYHSLAKEEKGREWNFELDFEGRIIVKNSYKINLIIIKLYTLICTRVVVAWQRFWGTFLCKIEFQIVRAFLLSSSYSGRVVDRNLGADVLPRLFYILFHRFDLTARELNENPNSVNLQDNNTMGVAPREIT